MSSLETMSKIPQILGLRPTLRGVTLRTSAHSSPVLRQTMSRKKTSVLLDDALSALFERYCDERGFKKSTLIARLIREHLERERFEMQTELFGKPKGEVPK